MRVLFLTLLSVLLATQGALAATLSNIQGRVLLNTGNGFAPVTGTVQVNPGDRVQVIDGSAQITYENGFVGTVGPGQTVAVVATPPPPVAGLGGLGAPVVIGGVVVAGGVVAAVAASNGGNDRPASP